MRDFNDSIDSLYNELLSFIYKYEILDDKAPFNNSIFQNIKALIEEFRSTQMSYNTTLAKQVSNLENQFSNMLKEYEKNKHNLEIELTNTKNEIKTRYEKKVNDLNVEVNKHKKQNITNQKNTMLDIEFYIIGSEQHIEMFENEYKDNTNRFAYQYSVAKDSYNENIIHYNDILEMQLDKLEKTHSTILNDFDKETEAIISAYNASIHESTILLEKKVAEYKDIMVQMKERKRNQTIELNDKIRDLVNIKNSKINDSRATYSSANNNTSIEKENKRQEYHLESQRISRDFVYNMNELDESITSAKNAYNAIAAEKQENQEEECYQLHLQLENKIKEIIEKAEKLSGSSKREIKKLKKIYHSLRISEIKRTDIQIKKMAIDHLIELEKSTYAKRLLDYDRTSAIKRLTEQETRDNKYYQEINNQHEIQMNYDIQIANSSFTVEANNVRLNGNITGLNLERVIDEIVAKHEKEIEAITTTIKKAKLEIDVALGINKLLHKFEEEKYQKRNNYLTVTNLLEIEKCKVLDIYNQRQYELNVANYNNILQYSKKKIEIQNEKYEKLQKQKLLIEDQKHNILISSTGYRIMEHSIDEFFEYRISENKNEYDINLLSHHILDERFKNELKELHFNLSTFVLLIRDLENLTTRLIDYIFDSITFRPEYLNIVKFFINDFIKICSSYYSKIAKDFKESAINTIQSRILFEEDFKFSETYSELKAKYTSNLSGLNIEKTSIYSAIEDCNNKIEDKRTQVFRLESSVSYKRTQKNRNKAEIKEINKAIRELYKEIESLNKEILEHEKAIASIDKRLAFVENKYVADQNDIKQRQYNGTLSYHKLKSDITSSIDSIIENLLNKVAANEANEMTYDNYTQSIQQNRQSFILDNTSALNILYKTLNDFSYNTSQAIASNLNGINTDYEKNINNLKKAFELRLNKCKISFKRKNKKELLELSKIEGKYKQLEKHYSKEEKINELQYQRNIKQVLLDKKESTNQFYIELYAVSDNAKDIELDYEGFLQDALDSFNKDKTELVNSALKKKSDLDTNLSTYIKTRNDLINHLPTAVKLQTKGLIQENKEKNKDVDVELANSKIQFNIKRKKIKRNLSTIESTYQSNINKIDIEHRNSITKEKKRHNINLRKIR